jgi:predicted MFS family arabinose efflux permease
MGTTLAQALAPLIAVTIIGDGALSNFRTLFFFMAGMCAVCAVADCCITYESKAKKEKSNAETAGGDETSPDDVAASPAAAAEAPEPPQKTILGFEYVVFAPMAVMALMFMGSAALNTFVVPFGRGIGISNPGYFYMISASGMFISRLVFGKVADRFGNDVVIIPGFIVLITGLALLPTAGSLPHFLALALPIGLAQGAVSPTFNSLLFKRSSPARRGSASGAAWSATDVGYAIGTPLLGLLADARDYRYVFWAGSISIAASLVLYVLIASDRVHNKSRARI